MDYDYLFFIHIFQTNHLDLQWKILKFMAKWLDEYSKFLADKKALITIIFGQYDEATKTKIALGAAYAADRQAERLIEFLRTVCFGIGQMLEFLVGI